MQHRFGARRRSDPTFGQCLGCHEMKKVLGNYDLSKDPHKGVCGIVPQSAHASDAAGRVDELQNSGCHANAETLTPFHHGIGAAALHKCSTCHQAHTWAVSGDKCIVCHESIFEDRPPGATSLAGGTPARLRRSAAGRIGGTGYTGTEGSRTGGTASCSARRAMGPARRTARCFVKNESDCQSCHHANARVTPAGSVSGPSSAKCTTCHTSIGLRQAIPETLDGEALGVEGAARESALVPARPALLRRIA